MSNFKRSRVKLSRQQYGYILISSSLFLLVSGFLYDYIMGASPCILCTMQRVILFLISITGLIMLRFQASFLLIALSSVGLLLSIRHGYVVMFPEEVTSCLPFELLLNLSGEYFIQGLINWLMALGRSCSVDIDPITYLLVPLLFVYYIVVLYIHQLIKDNQ